MDKYKDDKPRGLAECQLAHGVSEAQSQMARPCFVGFECHLQSFDLLLGSGYLVNCSLGGFWL